MASQHVRLEAGVDPYAVLGLAHSAPPDEIRRVYRSLVAEHHPDRLIAKGVPEDLIDVATARMKSINLAYQALTKPKQTPLLTADTTSA
jgi:DnaJ like chaperone protein